MGVYLFLFSSIYLPITSSNQILPTNVPTSKSLKINSTAEVYRPESDPITKSGTKLQRDEWMLLPPSIPSTLPSGPVSQPSTSGDKSLIEDYGESLSNTRTMSGGDDFFSSLGTAHKKNKPERPNPDQVLY